MHGQKNARITTIVLPNRLLIPIMWTSWISSCDFGVHWVHRTTCHCSCNL